MRSRNSNNSCTVHQGPTACVHSQEQGCRMTCSATSTVTHAQYMSFQRPECCCAQAFRTQPLYGRDLWEIGPALAANLQDVQTSCKEAASRLKQNSTDASTLSGLVGSHFHAGYLLQRSASDLCQSGRDGKPPPSVLALHVLHSCRMFVTMLVLSAAGSRSVRY